jgi:hypothetical protein
MIKKVEESGVNSSLLYTASIASVFLSIAIWVLKRGEDRANAERFGIFVGLWAPTLMAMGKVVEDHEIARQRGGGE